MNTQLDMSLQTPAKLTKAEPMAEQDSVACTPKQTQNRLSACKSCENFYVDEGIHTKCRATGCNISFMTTFNFKSCPKGNW